MRFSGNLHGNYSRLTLPTSDHYSVIKSVEKTAKLQFTTQIAWIDWHYILMVIALVNNSVEAFLANVDSKD